jgi:hypothetical protein
MVPVWVGLMVDKALPPPLLKNESGSALAFSFNDFIHITLQHSMASTTRSKGVVT